MDSAQHFKVSLKKALLKAKLTPSVFGERVGMSRQKIRALSDPSGNRKVDINDAVKIAGELNTTVGYMTGNVLTKRGLEAIADMADYIDEMERSHRLIADVMEKRDRNVVKNIRDLLGQIDLHK